MPADREGAGGRVSLGKLDDKQRTMVLAPSVGPSHSRTSSQMVRYGARRRYYWRPVSALMTLLCLNGKLHSSADPRRVPWSEWRRARTFGINRKRQGADGQFQAMNSAIAVYWHAAAAQT